MSLQDFVIRLAAAFVLGSLVGLERQYRQRMAGLRTNALVATGTALFVMITPLVGVGANPTQIPAYVISGIGFLAGGVIFKERMSVTGLNTAATMWCIAAIGALCGIGYIGYAALGAVAVVAANVILRPIAQGINRQPIDETEAVLGYEVRAVCREDVEDRIRATMVAAIGANGLRLHAVYSEDLEGTGRVEVIADVTATGRVATRLERVVSRLGVEPGVSAVSWKAVPTSDEESVIVGEA